MLSQTVNVTGTQSNWQHLVLRITNSGALPIVITLGSGCASSSSGTATIAAGKSGLIEFWSNGTVFCESTRNLTLVI